MIFNQFEPFHPAMEGAIVGRRAGVSPDETRDQVLAAATRVFARAGYERATVGDIAAEAGVSTGAIYAHYDGKAALFSAVLRAHVHRELARRLHDDRPFDIADFITDLGANLDRRPPAERTLLIEAVMSAKHDDKTRQALSTWFTERHEFVTAAIAAAQDAGSLTASVSSAAAARLATTVMLGSLVLDVLDLPEVPHDDWAALITRVVDGFRRGAQVSGSS
jgi:AcrR family transcriptional regulator